jgi:tetratricopeptide (TPR) repeat protein
MQGFADTARKRLEKEFTAAVELGSPFQLAFAQFVAAMLKVQLREPEAAKKFAEESISLSAQNGFPIIGDLSRMVLGRAHASLGRAGEGVSIVREGIAALPDTDRNGMTTFLSWLAEALALDGAIAEALATIEQALETNPMERAAAADALRIRGELRINVGQTESAEADFREAIARSQNIGAKSLELRATADLARMLRNTNRRVEARPILADIYGWFTEGFDTADLKDASALLEELSGSP